MNCLASPQKSELDPPKTSTELLLDLNLPEETQHTINNELNFCYNSDGFRLILKIFETYSVLKTSNKLLKEDLELAKLDLEYLELDRNNCMLILDETKEHLNKTNAALKIEIEKRKKAIRKEKIKTILIGSGAGIVGVAAGIVIGFFAIR